MKMKTRLLMVIIPIIVISIIMISGFFIYASLVTNSNLTHHDEIRLSIPDDHFEIHGIKWEWNNYIYDINEEISFTVSRYAKTCGDVFDARLMAPDWANTIWQESIKSKCEVDYDELVDNDYYSVLVTADFPSQNTIQLTEEGLYVLRIESKDSHTDNLNGQLIVKNKTHLKQVLLEQLKKTPRVMSMQNFTDTARDFIIRETLDNQEVTNLLSDYEYEVNCCDFVFDRNDMSSNRYVSLTFDVPEKYMTVVVTYDLTQEQISGVSTEILAEDGVIKVGEKENET